MVKNVLYYEKTELFIMKTEIKNIMIIGDSYSTFRGYIPEGYAVYYDENSGTDVFKVENTKKASLTQGHVQVARNRA